MKSVKLTNDDKCNIVNKIIEHATKDELKSLAEKNKKMSDDIYDMLIDSELQKKFLQIPSKYFSHKNILECLVGYSFFENIWQYRRYFVFSEHKIVPLLIDLSDYKKDTISNIKEMIITASEEIKDFEDKKEALRIKVRGIVNSHNTSLALKTSWKEISEFVDEVCAYKQDIKSTPNLPAHFDVFNKELKLPPQEKSDDK